MARANDQHQGGGNTGTRPVGRRQFIGTGGAVVVAGLAGCTSLGNSIGSSGGTPSPTEAHDGHGDGESDGEEHHDGHDEKSHRSTDDEHADHSHAEAPEEPADHVEVVMKTTDAGEAHFHPHVVWVAPGGSVTFRLESGSHTTTAYVPSNGDPRRIPEAATGWDSNLLSEAGETFQRRFETEGVYDYYCRPHEASGMVGSVLVGEPDLHHQPGMTSPGEDIPAGAREKIGDLNETVEKLLST